MKPLTVASLVAILLSIAAETTAQQSSKNLKPSVLGAADPGRFHLTLTVGDMTQEFEIPSKAISGLRRVRGRLLRSKDAETVFQAVIDVNGGQHEFEKPADALKAVQAVAAVMARARKLKIGFGEIGKLETGTGGDGKESARDIKSRLKVEQKKALSEQQRLLQAQRIVQYRIQRALSEELRRSRSYPNPTRLQQIAQAEYDKAKTEGLIPDNADPSAFNTSSADLVKQARLASLRQMLSKAFQSAKPADANAAEDKADKPKK